MVSMGQGKIGTTLFTHNNDVFDLVRPDFLGSTRLRLQGLKVAKRLVRALQHLHCYEKTKMSTDQSHINVKDK